MHEGVRLPALRHRFHALQITDVVRETEECRSFVLEAPAGMAGAYLYRPGQFLTFRVELGGVRHLRSYSLSSSPSAGEPMRVTVKRVPGGAVSNWMNDMLRPGDLVEAGVPSGSFVLREACGAVVLFAGGSGITPVLSILKTALLTSDREVRLLYANRDRTSVIFAGELDELQASYGDRLVVRHHLDADSGLVDADVVRGFLRSVGDDGDFYICGPGPFMRCVENCLIGGGTEPGRIRLERFTPAEEPPDEGPGPAAGSSPVDGSDLAEGSDLAAESDLAEGSDAAEGPAKITIRLGRREETTDVRPGLTILQAARSIGLRPPSSCESGSCASCMAQVVEGVAIMRNNEALTAEEVTEGWVLTCQAVPAGPAVRVVYE